jgi:hypothetical protein
MNSFFLKMWRLFFNKVSLMILTCQWFFLVVSFLLRPMWNAPLHFYYEPWIFWIMFLLNLPALAISEWVCMPINALIDKDFPLYGTFTYIILISLQWILIGVFINLLTRRKIKIL